MISARPRQRDQESRSGGVEPYSGANLVFVVGSPRSGTTHLQRLLSNHPLIKTGQETDVFDIHIGPQLRAWRMCMDPVTSGRAVGLPCYLKEEEFLAILRQYMLKLLEPMLGSLGPGQVFLEKTPSHALYIPEILELLPESRFVHVLRDGRDVVASLLAAGRTWGSHWAPRDPEKAAQMWVQHVQAVRRARADLPSLLLHEVRYENLIGQPTAELQRLVEFLGLDWDQKAMEYAVEQNAPEVARETGGTPIPLGGEIALRFSEMVAREPKDFVRNARAGGWRSELRLRARIGVWRAARHTLREVGYGWRLPW